MTGKDWLESKGPAFVENAYRVVGALYNAEGDAAVAEALTLSATLEGARVSPEILSKARSAMRLVSRKSPRPAAPDTPALALAPQPSLPGMGAEERGGVALERLATAAEGIERAMWAIELRLRALGGAQEAA